MENQEHFMFGELKVSDGYVDRLLCRFKGKSEARLNDELQSTAAAFLLGLRKDSVL